MDDNKLRISLMVKRLVLHVLPECCRGIMCRTCSNEEQSRSAWLPTLKSEVMVALSVRNLSFAKFSESAAGMTAKDNLRMSTT